MKHLALQSLLIFAVFTCSKLTILGQERSSEMQNAYNLCSQKIKDKNSDALNLCEDYLKNYPNDPYKGYIISWVEGYKKIMPYIQSIEKYLPADKSQKWVIYEHDLNKEIPLITDNEDSHKIEIIREFGSDKEEVFLNRAESVYESPSEISKNLIQNCRYWSQTFTSLPQNELIWSNGSFDSILETKTVTKSSAIYYLQISQNLKTGNKSGNFKLLKTSFKYWSSIKKFDKYERSGKQFSNVYVADMNLTWSHICGGRCGAGFTRNKVVILDTNGNVLEMFLDAKVNFGSWVS